MTRLVIDSGQIIHLNGERRREKKSIKEETQKQIYYFREKQSKCSKALRGEITQRKN